MVCLICFTQPCNEVRKYYYICCTDEETEAPKLSDLPEFIVGDSKWQSCNLNQILSFQVHFLPVVRLTCLKYISDSITSSLWIYSLLGSTSFIPYFHESFLFVCVCFYYLEVSWSMMQKALQNLLCCWCGKIFVFLYTVSIRLLSAYIWKCTKPRVIMSMRIFSILTLYLKGETAF